jgi:hypothetical protein
MRLSGVLINLSSIMKAARSIAEVPLQIPQQERRTLRKLPQEHVAAVIIAFVLGLGFVFGMWFDTLTRSAPRQTYPYYDTQKPVPPWSEPAPLEGNRNR